MGVPAVHTISTDTAKGRQVGHRGGGRGMPLLLLGSDESPDSLLGLF